MEQEFLKIFNKFTNIISIVGTTVTTTLGTEWILFAGYLILNITDYITGTLKSKIKKEESSSKGLTGIIKKICYWILIGVSFLMSYLLTEIGNHININISFVMIFGWFTLVCLIINEVRSILENLIEIGIDVPDILKKGLEVYNELINKDFNNLIDENSEEETNTENNNDNES